MCTRSKRVHSVLVSVVGLPSVERGNFTDDGQSEARRLGASSGLAKALEQLLFRDLRRETGILDAQHAAVKHDANVSPVRGVAQGVGKQVRYEDFEEVHVDGLSHVGGDLRFQDVSCCIEQRLHRRDLPREEFAEISRGPDVILPVFEPGEKKQTPIEPCQAVKRGIHRFDGERGFRSEGRILPQPIQLGPEDGKRRLQFM